MFLPFVTDHKYIFKFNFEPFSYCVLNAIFEINDFIEKILKVIYHNLRCFLKYTIIFAQIFFLVNIFAQILNDTNEAIIFILFLVEYYILLFFWSNIIFNKVEYYI